ncbi:hypothetical protein WR25_20480 [Diploscapter pachys]|uniref:F-box domain-containing protein n=1 Tax=Diploscapter pachys TaxID=2018661 RepID=A0A2A2JRY9_9BILA|nr:hypothetical protein WR25_20480 [Diploscapter pachys]
MILDGLPLELMRDVLLDLPTVDIIQVVKCTRRLHYFAKADKALGRRLQNRIFKFCLRLGGHSVCRKCRKLLLCLYLNAGFRRANDAAIQWNRFNFWFGGEECKRGYEYKCRYIDDLMPKIEPNLLDRPSFFYDSHLLKDFENGTKFVIKSDSMDDAVINCAKLFNIFTNFCVVRKLELKLYNNADHLWDKMDGFFNANPPDLRIRPIVSITSMDKLDNFLTSRIFSNGLTGIKIHDDFDLVLVNAYHEVFRRTPNVSFFGMDLPYTYEDLIGFFKDTKRLTFHSTIHITKQQLCQLVQFPFFSFQHFYEVKHDEECMFEIMIRKSFLVKNFLKLIPKEAYSLHLKRSGSVGSEPETRTWAEMTDRFGGRWAIADVAVDVDYGFEMDINFLRICSMKYFTEHDQSDSDSYQSGPYEPYSNQSDSGQSNSYQSDSD